MNGRVSTAAAIAVVVLAVSGCGSDTEADGVEAGTEPVSTDAPSTTADPTTTSEEPTTTVTSPAVADGADLVGTWTADAGDILASNTANLGGTGPVTCTGPILMTFNDAGTLSRSGNVVCGAMGIEGNGTISATADYAVPSPGTLAITASVNIGILTLGSQEIPFPDAFGDSTATYSVDGNTLSLTFSHPATGDITQTYVRA